MADNRKFNVLVCVLSNLSSRAIKTLQPSSTNHESGKIKALDATARNGADCMADCVNNAIDGCLASPSPVAPLFDRKWCKSVNYCTRANISTRLGASFAELARRSASTC